MNKYWNHIQIVKLLIPLLVGVIFALQYHFNSPSIYYVFSVTIIIFIFLYIFSSTDKSFKWKHLHGWVIYAILFTGGIALVEFKTPVYQEDYFANYMNDSSIIKCRITAPPQEKAKSYSAAIRVMEVINNDRTYYTSGKSILYLKKDSLKKNTLKYGDILIVKNTFTQPALPKNPHEFNYRKYLNNQGIYYTAFLKNNQYCFSGNSKINPLWNIIYNSRMYCSNLLEKYTSNLDARAVGQALLLGDSQYLNYDIKNVYSGTGTMHLLAVSGLHVGIFYFILEFLFSRIGFLKNNKGKLKYVKPTIIVCIIWFYAALTGLSPSVCRSAVMFSFLTYGRLMLRPVNSYNVLAASAIPLIIWNPYIITQVGFQLSYFAILGIIFFQPKFYKIYKPENTVQKYFWSLNTVSVAAQLGTAPISVFYFHQFPNYFLISNMIAIPISFVALTGGLMFIAVSFSSALLHISAFILEWSLIIMNSCLAYIDIWPGALWSNIQMSLTEMILLYLCICMAGVFIVSKSKKYLMAALSTLFVFISLVSERKIEQQHQSSVGVYSLKTSSAIAIIERNKCLLIKCDTTEITPEEYNFYIKNDLISKGITEHKNTRPAKLKSDISFIENCAYKNNYLAIGNTLIYITQHKNIFEYNAVNVHVNCVFVSQNPYLKIAKIDSIFPEALFVFDDSNKKSSVRYWTKTCNEMHIPFHSMPQSGYLNYDQY